MIELVDAASAGPPGGHYSHAVRSNGLLFVSGILPIAAMDGIQTATSFDTQVERVLANAEAILLAGGSAWPCVVKATAYLVGVVRWSRFDVLYASKIGERRPARVIVPVPELHHGILVELELIAETDQ